MNRTISAATLLLAAQGCFAQATGLYLALSPGQSTVHGLESELSSGATRLGAVQSVSAEATDQVVTLAIGGAITPSLLLELGYGDLGAYSFTALNGAEVRTGEVRGHGFSASLLPQYHAGPFALYGRIGAFGWRREIRLRESGGLRSEQAEGVSPLYGAGIELLVGNSGAYRWSLLGEYQYIAGAGEHSVTGETDIRLLTLGIKVTNR